MDRSRARLEAPQEAPVSSINAGLMLNKSECMTPRRPCECSGRYQCEALQSSSPKNAAARFTDVLHHLLQMQQAYTEYNAQVQSSSKSRGHFMVDLCKPGHLTACLRCFQEAVNCKDDSWDAQFGEQEGTRDLALPVYGSNIAVYCNTHGLLAMVFKTYVPCRMS